MTFHPGININVIHGHAVEGTMAIIVNVLLETHVTDINLTLKTLFLFLFKIPLLLS